MRKRRVRKGALFVIARRMPRRTGTTRVRTRVLLANSRALPVRPRAITVRPRALAFARRAGRENGRAMAGTFGARPGEKRAGVVNRRAVAV